MEIGRERERFQKNTPNDPSWLAWSSLCVKTISSHFQPSAWKTSLPSLSLRPTPFPCTLIDPYVYCPPTTLQKVVSFPKGNQSSLVVSGQSPLSSSSSSSSASSQHPPLHSQHKYLTGFLNVQVLFTHSLLKVTLLFLLNNYVFRRKNPFWQSETRI